MILELCNSKRSICFVFCIGFVHWSIASFSYSYLYPNYCDNNSCQSFLHLVVIAKRYGKLIAISIVGRAITIEEIIKKRRQRVILKINQTYFAFGFTNIFFVYFILFLIAQASKSLIVMCPTRPQLYTSTLNELKSTQITVKRFIPHFFYVI